MQQVRTRNNVTSVGAPDGPVLMFAHGFGCDQDMWRRVVPSFVDDYRVVLFDHVGAGRSDIDAYDPVKYSTLAGYAGDVLEICAELELERVTLVGHSVSAMIAILAAVERPATFERLVLVAPSPSYIDHPDDAYVGGFSEADIDGLLESLNSNYYAWAAAIAPMVMGPANDDELGDELAGSFCRTNPDIATKFARVTFLSDSRAVLGDLTTPTLILQCCDDMLAPIGVGLYLHEHLAGSTLVQLTASGHCPHVSAPAETAAVILDYLQRTR